MSTYINIRLNPKYESLSPFVFDITASGLPDDATLVYKSRNKIVRTLHDGLDINIKAFKLPNLANRYIYSMFRKSKAERSYLNAWKLIDLGFHTPEPIGFGEEKVPGRLKHSYYFSIQIEASEMRNMETRPDAAALLHALGTEMARLHRAGVWMKDFSPGNVLFTRTSSGSYIFNHVDLNRIEFDCHDNDKLMRMFGAMVYTDEHLRMLSDGYAIALGLDLDETYRMALKQVDRFNRYRERKARLKKLLR